MSLFKNLYEYRELLSTSVKKEIRGKYKGAWLGILWSYLNPLLMLVVYSFVFSIIMRVQIENYSMYLFTALIPWNFFVTSISQGSLSVISNGSILKKVYFPREIVPIASVTANTVNFMISCLIIFFFLAVTGVGFSIYILFLPLIILIQYILLLGIVFFVSSMTVYARDLEHIISVILMAGIYATPIFYTMEMVPDKFKKFIALNPMTHIINSYRDVMFYKRMPNMKLIGIMFVVSTIILILGYSYFKKTEKSFVEEL